MDNYLNLIEKSLASYQFGRQPTALYDPIRYILSLGGKRLRPVLTLMSCELFGGDIQKALNPALGVEVFHNFTLLHDDIMDKAPIRRGKSTVHKKWNENVAILSGDVMLVKAYELMAKAPQNVLAAALQKFNTCAAEVCEGQQYDMDFESQQAVSEEAYLEMIKLKTAVLLGLSLELGAIIAEASPEKCLQIHEIGINIGLGFQLKDDLLDVYADTGKFGKQVGGDIIANKKTYLLIKAMESATGHQKEELDSWIQKEKFEPTEKVHAVTEIYNHLDLKHICEQKMNAYFQDGFDLLDILQVPEASKAPLRNLLEKLVDREK